jgi:hypothetical protein
MAGGETVRQLLAQDEGEEGAEDVAADAGIGFVEDRPGGEQRFCRLEGILHRQQVAVAQNDAQRRDLCIGPQHEETVVARIGLDLGAIDDKAVACGRLEKAAEPLVGDERFVALCESVVVSKNAIETAPNRGWR